MNLQALKNQAVYLLEKAKSLSVGIGKQLTPIIIAEQIKVGPNDSRYQGLYEKHPHECKSPTISVNRLTDIELKEKYLAEHPDIEPPAVFVILPDNGR